MKKLFFTYCILLLFIATVSSQDIPKKLYQAEKCSSPILIDGIFDEEAWKGKWEGGFIQREPIENARPSQEAQFRIVCDNENIYVAIKALDSESLSSSQLRGGPAMLMPRVNTFACQVTSDIRKKLSFKYKEKHIRQGNNSSSSDQFSPIISYQPFNTLQFSFEPSYIHNKNELQYVSECDYQKNSRYILGSLNQHILSFSARINININPNLTTQYWGQPFLTSGKYDHFKKTTATRAKTYVDRFQVFNSQHITTPDPDNYYLVDENKDGNYDYKFENPDFNFNEFLSNLVLRWEYLPGSALYLVWS